jgi:hypothetical protein
MYSPLAETTSVSSDVGVQNLSVLLECGPEMFVGGVEDKVADEDSIVRVV